MRRILMAVGVTAMALGGLTAFRPAVGCGSVLTADTRLTADLTGCAGDALVIGADGITLDLDGHTVSSTGGIGVRADGRDHVTVRDGTIRGATSGLAVTDARLLVVDGVEAHGEHLGMDLERVSHSRVVRSTAYGLYGYLLAHSHHNRMEASDAPGLGPDSGYGLRIEGSDHNRISGGRFSGGDDSIRLLDADHNTIVGTDASGSNTVGISLTRSDHNVVRGNIGGSEVGAVEVNHSEDNLIERTRLSRPYGGSDNESIKVLWSVGTRVRHNDVGNVVVRDSQRTEVRDNTADWISVTGSDRTTVRRNDVDPSTYWAADDGIDVGADATRTLLSDNMVTGFAGDGIAVEAPGTVLRRNVANDNGDYGIQAVPGVVDGGRNRASGNGNPAQCLGVTCT